MNLKWSMDFVGQHLPDGLWIRVLVDNTLSGDALLRRGTPEPSTVDNGAEFTSKALDH